MNNVKERLRLFIKENGGNQAEVARKMGISPTYLGVLFSVKDKGLSATIIKGFADAGFDVQWLLTGESKLADAEKRISDLETELRDEKRLNESLERILSSKNNIN
jgi:transcriptional regulator with XRE-family HTH domain